MSTAQLVQITFPRNDQWSVAEREKAASLAGNLPRAYVDLRKMFEAIFKELGAKTVCTACFAGKLNREKGRGCCGGCAALSTTGCTSKPIACASFFHCEHMSELFGPEIGRLYRYLDRRCRDLRISDNGADSHPYHINGFIKDAETKWSPKQVMEMQTLWGELYDLLHDIQNGRLKRGKSAKEIVQRHTEERKRRDALNKHIKKHGYNTALWRVHAPDTSRATA